ncbi:alpha-amylase family protein [Paenibacillus segetis]|uniref:Beta-galactosidase trimerisation domain-containing protein n=1 Tax=Paenibacillus segetis TaxID=1325360 RepID=A0ABQ1YKV0_9BACL|nr:alpha-amylase family protein [Paenibacillus segetis]GGH28648.1 hypothetical protein GCM10008013_30790 [Paenibacillus segetis]
MRFRQVHLDFHTSEAIPNIGKQFSKENFQRMLKLGAVDSITVFSKCHHGWAYHPSVANEQHPGLTFDLLGAMIEAAHEINVKTPVYLSAGLDEKLAIKHPEWLVRDKDDQTNWVKGFLQPGYHVFCMNTPYLDILLQQIEEVVRGYDVDGIFLDIVGARKCYCHTCLAELRLNGKDPRDEQHIIDLGEQVYMNYCLKVKELIHGIRPGLPIFHNGGHIPQGRRDLAQMNTHLELESLPTGGWGYDHFPLSARYAQTLGMEFLGMTGKFHTTWGEFGGYKHPNALRYEAALSIANGASCSIGDQLHPDGLMDEATYELIGAAYREVEAKEEWCSDVTNVADVALLSLEAMMAKLPNEQKDVTLQSDVGAARILLEGHVLFDVIDAEADFNAYKVIILPDYTVIGDELQLKLQDFVTHGGKLLCTGKAGLNTTGDAFLFDCGAEWVGANEYKPDYFRPGFKLKSLLEAAFVMYSDGQKVKLLPGGTELGRRENPYFNRDLFTFCSHQHAPSAKEYGGPGMTEGSAGIYIAWQVFHDYAVKGSLILKEMVLYAMGRLLGNRSTMTTNLPAQGIVTLQHQTAKDRYVNHLLYAAPVRRGDAVEIIEDIIPLFGVDVQLQLEEEVSQVYLAPQLEQLPYTQIDGVVTYKVPEIHGHQMVVIQTK